MLLEVFTTLVCLVTCHGYLSLLYTTTKDVRIANISRPNKAPTFIKDLEGGAGVDFYYKGNLICWADHEVEAIQCAHYNESTSYTSNPKKVTVVSNDVTFPDGLACDWLTQKLYWTDADTSRLEVITLDGLYRKILFWEDIDQPRAIALVPTESIMFWTDWGEVPKIERASMDGDLSSRRIIVSERIFWPNGLTADFDNRKLYWVDGKLKFIEVMDYDGKNRRIVADRVLVYPYALTMYHDNLYWTDWNISSVYTLDRVTGEHRELVSNGDAVPIDIKVMDPSRQPHAETGCTTKPNGGCSHLCLLSSVNPLGYSCACPTGVKLVDNYTCANGPQELLLLAQTREICTISLDSPDHTCVQIPLKGIKHAMDISYDPVHGFIYWTDEAASLISRARLDGSQQEIVVGSDLVSPDGLAVDWRAGNLYWIDAGTDRIQVLRINTTYTKVLINSELLEPRSIAISPDEGLMFWSDWNEKSPKLEKAALDGSMRDILVRDHLGWPNGITVDIDNRRLYWCDAKTEKIEMITYEGRDRREVVTDNLPHVFGLTLIGDYLYWTDWQRRSIEAAHKTLATNRTVILDQTANMMGLKAVGPLRKPGPNPCAVNNGNCAHLCLKTPNSYVCTCQMGYEVDSNGRKCVVPEAFLLFAKKDNIGRISIENRQNDAIIPASGIKDASSLNFDINDNRIYWTDVKAKAITRAYINGSHVEKVIEFGLESPEGLAVDWVAGNMYWTDTGTKRIEASRLDGWFRRAIIWTDLDEPRSIAVDPFQGFIYWSDWGGQGSLNKSRLDGSQARTVMTKVGRANSLALDLAERRIYWCAVQGFIESAMLDGSGRQVVVTSPRPFTMSLYQDKIYWSDWSTGGLYSANKHVGSNQTLVHSRLEQVTSIAVYHDWGGTTNGRLGGNGVGAGCGPSCPALCLGRCVCPTHYTLVHDVCLPPPSFLLFSIKNTVRRLVFNSTECPDTPLPVHGLKNVRAIDYDPLHHSLYWIDGGRSHSIRRWKMSPGGGGSGRSFPMVTGIEKAFSLAVESNHRLLYWSSPGEGVINATKLDNGSTPTVIVKSHDSERPKHIALHSLHKLLVWVSGGRETRIYVCQLDGSERTTLVSSLPPSISSLAVDTVDSIVYWMTANTIEAIDIHGSKRREVVKDNLSKVSELVVLGPSLYWVQNSKVVGYNRHTMKTRTAFYSHHHITTLTAVTTPSRQTVLDAQDGWECSGGERVDSPLDCSESGRVCSRDLFTCPGTLGDCIPAEWRCDGVSDCPDSSDETNCPPCPPDKFRCAQGQCIEMRWVCDGTQHCRDHSDERDCCAGHECGGHCIALEAVCDGWQNCADGSDEAPQACSAKQAALPARPIDPTHPPPPHHLLVVCIFTAVCFLLAGLILYKCQPRLSWCCRGKPGQVLDPALDPLNIGGVGTGCGLVGTVGYRSAGSAQMMKGSSGMRMSTLTSNGGSSGNGGSALFYPINPPPSPATTLARPLLPLLYHPPPPTPCSTDVPPCDTDSNYQGDSEPLPPPPTPTSLSPSSSTYFHPVPPPPSPTP